VHKQSRALALKLDTKHMTATHASQDESGTSAGSLKAVTTAGKQAFESTIRLPHAEHYVAAQAPDSRGRALATSKTVKVS